MARKIASLGKGSKRSSDERSESGTSLVITPHFAWLHAGHCTRSLVLDNVASRHKLTSGNRHVVSPAPPCPAAAAGSSVRRRQGEDRGAGAFGAGAGDGRRRQGTRGAERRRALRSGLRDQDRDRVAGAAGARRRLPL